jgi:prolyl-tRNA editing enzyme YbaK/EbsC (Cys-tRNA(Pro) deacylase)
MRKRCKRWCALPIKNLAAQTQMIDQELARFDVIWAAAGHPHAVFQLTMAQLQDLTQAPVADVAQAVIA